MTNAQNLPAISVVFATLNAARVLENCLGSIARQDYPKNKIEVIIADGGSTDDTLSIIRKFKIRVVDNPLKTSEAGKAVGVKQATGDLVAFIDSDNILPVKDWFKKMVEPLEDEEIVGSEPIEYTYRKNDPWLTRYFALIGMNDPMCLFIGNYDRLCTLTGGWTNLKFPLEDKGNYLKIKFDHEPLPTIGANGTLLRKKIFADLGVGDYLFDIDVLVDILRKKNQIYFAKVKTGIVHTYVEDDIKKFFRKQLRRINDMSFHRAKKARSVDWEKFFFWKIIYFQLQCILVFPIFYQMVKGMIRRPDICWLFHPIACYSTWFIYLYGWIKGKFVPKESNREGWRQ